MPLIVSDRITFLAVVGESYCQDALARLLAAHPDRTCLIALVPEPDNPADVNAIKVVSADDNAMLGYLSRKNAVEFHEAAAALNSKGACYHAKINGGTSAKPRIGVSFDAAPMYEWQDRRLLARAIQSGTPTAPAPQPEHATMRATPRRPVARMVIIAAVLIALALIALLN
jgi:hypothetical protein